MRRRSATDSDAESQLTHWGRGQSLAIARRLNEKCLYWLLQAATAEDPYPLDVFRQNDDLWRKLDPRAISRAARTPIFLVNCNFQHLDWWKDVAAQRVPPIVTRESNRRPIAEDAPFVLREVLTEARTIAVSKPRTAAVVLGAPTMAVTILASLSLAEIEGISGRYALELRPRWADKPIFWRNLLSAALGETESALAGLCCHSLQLIGSDLLVNPRED